MFSLLLAGFALLLALFACAALVSPRSTFGDGPSRLRADRPDDREQAP